MRQRKGARAEIRQTMTKNVHGEKEQIKNKSMTVKVPNAEELIGDGNANVSRTRTEKFAVPDSYGTAISSSCTVALTCNQDDKTIHKTATLCNRILEKLAEEDRDRMLEFVKEMR